MKCMPLDSGRVWGLNFIRYILNIFVLRINYGHCNITMEVNVVLIWHYKTFNPCTLTKLHAESVVLESSVKFGLAASPASNNLLYKGLVDCTSNIYKFDRSE